MASERIVIIGGGVAGLALAQALADRGAGGRTTLIEAEEGLGQHSSGKNAAILRTAIPAPLTRRLALESAARLRSAHLRAPLLDEVGLCVACAGEPPWLAEHLEADEVYPVEGRELARLAPHWHPTKGTRVWYLPRQGRIDVAALIEYLAKGARAGGVELRLGEPVRALGRGRVTLAGGETLQADSIVLAAGAWVDTLARTRLLRVTRRHLLVTAPDPRVDPRWPVVWDDKAEFYARPESAGLLLSACDISDCEPDGLQSDPSVMALLARKVAASLPDYAEAGAAHFWPGLRALAPDDTPLIGPDPHREGLFWMAGLGGHGMSLSLSIGEVAADLLLDRAVDPLLAAGLAPGRFAHA